MPADRYGTLRLRWNGDIHEPLFAVVVEDEQGGADTRLSRLRARDVDELRERISELRRCLTELEAEAVATERLIKKKRRALINELKLAARLAARVGRAPTLTPQEPER